MQQSGLSDARKIDIVVNVVIASAVMVAEPKLKTAVFVRTVENRNRGCFGEPRERFQPRQFWAGCLENAAYMQWVAQSIQGLNMQTISDTPTCTLSQF